MLPAGSRNPIRGAIEMFSIGEAVLYGNEGVCIIERLEEMKVGRTKAQYYVLRPVYRNSSTLFIPAASQALLEKIRPILTKEEIHALLTQASQEEGEWIEDPAERKTAYQNILSGGDRALLLRTLRLVYRHRDTLNQKGKHLRNADEQFLRDAEKLLHSELAFVLDIPQARVQEYIRSYLE